MIKKNERQNLQNIELMRFIGMLLIMGHHLYHIGYGDGYLLQRCWVWVDFFFILSGAFTYRHYADKKNIADCGKEALEYTFKKFKRFVPLTVLAVILQYVADYGHSLKDGNWKEFIVSCYKLPYEIMYLSSSGIIGERLAPIWYLSAMFIVLPLFVYMIIKHGELWKVVSLLIPVLYFGYMGVNTVRTWPNDLVRAFSCMALGSLAYIASQRLKQVIRERNDKNIQLLLIVVELGSVVLAIYISAANKSCINLMELIFFVMTVLMLSGVTVSSKLNSSVVDLLGKMSMPMFLLHWVVGSIIVLFPFDIRLRTLVYYIGTLIVSALAVRIKSKR